MNSDPYDSAAWRTFGMLDDDETAMFDDAMREDPALRRYSLEMDRLSAAIAAGTVIPAEPGIGQLERIQNRLNLNSSRHTGIWLAVSGWAAAAVLAIVLISNRNRSADQTPAASLPPPAIPAANAKTPPKAVAKRLTQEIEVLRENLEKFQHRDRVLFTEVPGMALPIVMTMTPPGVGAGDTPITTLLGDALRANAIAPEESSGQDAAVPADTPSAAPTAMPIYDSARDIGTLVINNLPENGEDEAYNLWVTTEPGGKPIYVGSLPDTVGSGDSFDFSLGSTMILPSGFMLTRDPMNAPAMPAEDNIVLRGPPVPTG